MSSDDIIGSDATLNSDQQRTFVAILDMIILLTQRVSGLNCTRPLWNDNFQPFVDLAGCCKSTIPFRYFNVQCEYCDLEIHGMGSRLRFSRDKGAPTLHQAIVHFYGRWVSS